MSPTLKLYSDATDLLLFKEFILKPVKRVAIVYREQTAEAQQLAVEVAHWLIDKKITVFSHPKQSINMGKNKVKNQVKKLEANGSSRLDLVIVLGGDGTYLEAVRLLGGRQTPILGINLGSLGFLTARRQEELYPSIEKAIRGELEQRPRSKLDIKLKKNGKTIVSQTALNDVVIERGGLLTHLINLELYCDQLFVSKVKADGVIVASPTGSTAYNLAAGGPVLHPETKALVVTPICAHSLTFRPLIFPDNKELCLRLEGASRKAFLTVDGLAVTEITQEHHIHIKRSSRDHFVLRDKTHNYFDLLREKLKFGERA